MQFSGTGLGFVLTLEKMAATPTMATAVVPVEGKCGWSAPTPLALLPFQFWPSSAAHRLAACLDASSGLRVRSALRCAAASEGSSKPFTRGSETGDGKEDANRESVENVQPLSVGPSVNSSRTPQSTDWIASSLTRRFGLGAGLAWVSFLAFGVISEQIKTRTEVFLEEQGTRDVEDGKEVVLPNSIRYVDLRLGGGSSPQRGDLVLVDFTGMVSGQQFVDTTSGNRRSLAFVFGTRPYASGMCEGVEIVLQSMRAGGKRRAVIPPELGFGEEGAQFGDSVKVPGGSELEYVVQLQKVSIAPGYYPVFEEYQPC